MERNRIKETLKSVCEKQNRGDLYSVLEKLLDHITENENETEDNRATEFQNMIYERFGEE